jgi:hypothetical protein
MKRIPIKAAHDVASKYNQSQVILISFDKEDGLTHVVTYGKTLKDCNEAAQGGNFFKKAMGWTEHCDSKPRRVMNRPTVVCLCGSTRFKDAFEKASREETLNGNIVLSVGLFGHLEGLDMNGDTKKMLDELHKRKIDLADEVLFLNVDGYIGESTKRELEYSKKNKKIVRFLESC